MASPRRMRLHSAISTLRFERARPNRAPMVHSRIQADWAAANPEEAKAAKKAAAHVTSASDLRKSTVKVTPHPDLIKLKGKADS